MELAAPIALWKVYQGKVVAGGLCYAAMFSATISSASRTGVLLVLAELAVFVILMVVGRRMPLKSAVSIIAALAVLVAGASMVAGTERIRDRFQEQSPYALRGMLVQSSLQMIPLHPWFGSGMGTWPALYPRFATFDAGVYVNEAHNDWAQWAIEGGIPFALLLAALVVWLTGPAVRSVWGLGIVSVMVHSFVDYPLREPVLLFFWFVLAGALTQIR
jgi:O-antigen ligase